MLEMIFEIFVLCCLCIEFLKSMSLGAFDVYSSFIVAVSVDVRVRCCRLSYSRYVLCRSESFEITDLTTVRCCPAPFNALSILALLWEMDGCVGIWLSSG